MCSRTAYNPSVTTDLIPREDDVSITVDPVSRKATLNLYAFNTVVTVMFCVSEMDGCERGILGDASVLRNATSVVDACRYFERIFSRTLQNSDVTRLNTAAGRLVEIHRETYEILCAAKYYCAKSQGVFDITLGAATRLWDFHNGIVPDEEALRQALTHVDYRMIEVLQKEEGLFARLSDSKASIDLGGLAKGYIADALADLLLDGGVTSFVINLGGNVYVHGRKPDGTQWKVGIKNPNGASDILGAIQLENASAVTSGVYERSFEIEGELYHHILSPGTGYPVKTDVAGVTVVCEKSLDAEGYSTTLLALGSARGCEFVRGCPEIIEAIFVTNDNRVITA